MGLKDVTIVVSEGKPLKRMNVKVFVQSPLTVEVSPMEGRPGQTQVTVNVGQPLGKALSGMLRMRVPDSWKALTPEIPIAELKPQEVRPVVCKFQWSADWKPHETARIELDFGADKRVTRPLIPNQYAIHRARKDHARRPAGRLGAGHATARLDAGLHAPESRAPRSTWPGPRRASTARSWCTTRRCQVQDPKSFWAGDALELFLDTADNKQPRSRGRRRPPVLAGSLAGRRTASTWASGR